MIRFEEDFERVQLSECPELVTAEITPEQYNLRAGLGRGVAQAREELEGSQVGKEDIEENKFRVVFEGEFQAQVSLHCADNFTGRVF